MWHIRLQASVQGMEVFAGEEWCGEEEKEEGGE
jgi:hypothetical protein